MLMRTGNLSLLHTYKAATTYVHEWFCKVNFDNY